MASNWGAKASERLCRQQQRQQMEKQIRLENRTLIQEQAPNLQIELWEYIKQKCVELNKSYGAVVARVKDTVLNRLDVRLELDGSTRDLTVKFEVTTSQRALQWEYSGDFDGSAKRDTSSLYIQKDGTVVFRKGEEIRTPESLAEEMLDGLLPE